MEQSPRSQRKSQDLCQEQQIQTPQNPPKQPSDEQFQFTQINDINPIILLKKPKSYKQCFQFIFKMGTEQLQMQNYDQSIRFYQKTVQMLDIGRNVINKDSYPQLQYMKIITFANLACAYLNIRKLQKCNKCCEKSIEEIQKFLISAENQTFLKMSLTLMVLKFQNCAILSQLEQHQRSLQLCKSNLTLIRKYLQILDIFVRQSLTISYQKRKSNETVSFSRQVYKFAASTIKQLLEYIEQPMLNKEQMVFYYWQKNPQKNEEQLLKKFIPMENENCKRSILGVSKKNHWIDQFNIGSVMHMMPLKLEQLMFVLPKEEYVFKDKLYEITIYCSMSYFTMATETRFIDSNLKTLAQSSGGQVGSPQMYKGDQSPKDESILAKKLQNLGNLKIMKKYGYSQKTQMYKRSEVYHLCSIDVMSKVVKYAIPYINHILKSYQKHYIKEKKLQQIFAIAEESFQEQDTIVNQSIAEYCPYDNVIVQKQINVLPPMTFSKNKKNSHVLDSQTQIKGFDEILEGDIKIIDDLSDQEQPIKLLQKKNSEQIESPLQNSGEYLQSVIKKKKSVKSSRIKADRQDMKESKQTKRKVAAEKSPTHSIPLGNPPKPPIKKKKL